LQIIHVEVDGTVPIEVSGAHPVRDGFERRQTRARFIDQLAIGGLDQDAALPTRYDGARRNLRASVGDKHIHPPVPLKEEVAEKANMPLDIEAAAGTLALQPRAGGSKINQHTQPIREVS
jgi:hypothetical protein